MLNFVISITTIGPTILVQNNLIIIALCRKRTRRCGSRPTWRSFPTWCAGIDEVSQPATRFTPLYRAQNVTVLSALFYSKAQLLPSRKFKRDHVCAICDGRHRLALADFGNTSHVDRRFGPEHG